jgi:hypothetical protein
MSATAILSYERVEGLEVWDLEEATIAGDEGSAGSHGDRCQVGVHCSVTGQAVFFHLIHQVEIDVEAGLKYLDAWMDQ